MLKVFGFSLLMAALCGCATMPQPVYQVPTVSKGSPQAAVIPGPEPKGETHPMEFASPPAPDGAMEVQTFVMARPSVIITNQRPPVAKNGTAIEFMPFATNVPIRYIGQWSKFPDADWQTYTNVILDGPAHPFYFYMLDGAEPRRFFRTVWRPL